MLAPAPWSPLHSAAQHKRDKELKRPVRAQGKATKVQKSLSCLGYKESLGELGLLGLQKTRLPHGHKHLKGDEERTEPGHARRCPAPEPGALGTAWSTRRHHGARWTYERGAGHPAGAGGAWRYPEVPQASAGVRHCDHNHIGHVLYVTYVVNSQLAKLNKSLNEF